MSSAKMNRLNQLNQSAEDQNMSMNFYNDGKF